MDLLAATRGFETRGLARLAGLAVLAGAAFFAHAGGLDNFYGVSDGPSRSLPGRYFEEKAQFYLKKKDYAEASRLFELSGFYADKLSQYNAGIMYYNGIGVPTDKARGVAWLGIAAQTHESLADAALQAAYAELTPDERAQSSEIFRELAATYGDAVALPRALRQYALDARISLFGFGATGPGTVYTAAGARGLEENSADFVHRLDAQRAALIAQITGHVTVGAVQPLPVPERDKRDASHTVLDLDTGEKR